VSLPRRVIVTTVPFGEVDRRPLELLKAAGVELVINPKRRRLTAEEVPQVIAGFPVVIAGTEPVTAEAMAACTGVRAICRVGIGLDSIDLVAARKLGIAVAYTPDGPSAAVAELTVGLIIDLLRGIAPADRDLRQERWTRRAGIRIATSTVGVIGVGRIGRRVIRHLQGGFAGVRILANDPMPDPTLDGVLWVEKETIYREADVITLHLPLTSQTFNLIAARELSMMKPSTVLVNTARGGIVNESDLASALTAGKIKAAALDVFTHEPYKGPLTALPNALLTCHMGSMTADCRARMEIEATEDAIRFLDGAPLRSPVPQEEYANAAQRPRH
jgi:D-3-phosphoglycerate dehydrogenase / 2-oxoglutarate reductase